MVLRLRGVERFLPVAATQEPVVMLDTEAPELDQRHRPSADATGAARARLDRLWRRGREFLGSEHAILCGAMSWVSERNLVAAVCNAGGFGVIAAAAMPADELEEEIVATAALTRYPFGVNLVTLHPLFDELLDRCITLGVSHVVLAGGLPPARAIARLKDAGAKVMCFAPTLALAKRLVRNGVDAIIIEGMEAGGHIGPSTTSVLAQEILPHLREVPVFVAGGIGRGEAIAAYLEMGAAGCQLGTIFAAALESTAHAAFKKALFGANARDAVVSPQLDPALKVIPVRAINNAAMKEFLDIQREVLARRERGEIDAAKAQESIEHFWAGRLRRAVVNGDIENGSLMAGQSVGMVREELSAQAIIDKLIAQTLTIFARTET